MRDVLHGALFHDVDIEYQLKEAFTIIRVELGISEHSWDRTIKPRLEFLNALFGVKFVMSAKSYSRYFEEKTSDFIIHEITSGPNFGSVFCLEQSIDCDFLDSSTHDCTSFFAITGKETIPFVPQFMMADAYSVKGRAHTSLTNVQRVNGGWNQILQNPLHSRAEVTVHRKVLQIIYSFFHTFTF